MDERERAESLLSWLSEQPAGGVCRSNVLTHGPAGTRTSGNLDAALSCLADCFRETRQGRKRFIELTGSALAGPGLAEPKLAVPKLAKLAAPKLAGPALAKLSEPALAALAALAPPATDSEIPSEMEGLRCGGCGRTRYKRVVDGYQFPDGSRTDGWFCGSPRCHVKLLTGNKDVDKLNRQRATA